MTHIIVYNRSWAEHLSTYLSGRNTFSIDIYWAIFFLFLVEAGKIALNQFIQQEALNDGGGGGHSEDGMIDAVTGEQITEETIVEHQGQDEENHVSEEMYLILLLGTFLKLDIFNISS